MPIDDADLPITASKVKASTCNEILEQSVANFEGVPFSLPSTPSTSELFGSGSSSVSTDAALVSNTLVDAQANLPLLAEGKRAGVRKGNMAEPVVDDRTQTTVTGIVDQSAQQSTVTRTKGKAKRGSVVNWSDRPDTVTVCHLQSASQFSMPIQVGDRVVEAVVDSGAEASIISDTVYRSLSKRPSKIKRRETTHCWS